jgi:peptidoglycan/xylan/chitin deacetylase (PgdA/CDA1 family)
LADRDLAREVQDPREVIQGVTGRPVRALSYPYSHVDARVKYAVQAAGYSCAFAVNSGPFHAARDLWEIRRVNVTAHAHGSSFRAKLNGVEKIGLWTWSSARRLVQSTYEIRRGF